MTGYNYGDLMKFIVQMFVCCAWRVAKWHIMQEKKFNVWNLVQCIRLVPTVQVGANGLSFSL